MHFLAAGGQTPFAECPAENVSFFYVLPNFINMLNEDPDQNLDKDLDSVTVIFCLCG